MLPQNLKANGYLFQVNFIQLDICDNRPLGNQYPIRNKSPNR